MSVPVRKAGLFLADFEHQSDWYVSEGGPELALRFDDAVKDTLVRIGQIPTIGRKRRFRHPMLANLRSFAVTRPFSNVLVFYKIRDNEVEIWRLMHGSRDLARRLLEPND